MALAVSALIDWLPPDVGLVPNQAPEAVQEVASVEDQVRMESLPLATDGGSAASDTVGTGGGGAGGAEPPPPPPPQEELRTAKMITQLPLDETIFPLPINQPA